MKPRHIRQKEIENEFMRKQLKKTVAKDDRITMPKYLCDQCEKNYWTRRVLVQKSMFDTMEFKICEFCFVLLEEICRFHGHRLHTLVMRRTEENAREIDKRLANQ